MKFIQCKNTIITKDYHLMLGLRPWPLSIGPQVKLGPLTFSAEWGARDPEISVETELILTSVVRFKIKSKEEKLKKVNLNFYFSF